MYERTLIVAALVGALAVSCGDDNDGDSVGGSGGTTGGSVGDDNGTGGESPDGSGGTDGASGGADNSGSGGTSGGAGSCADYCAYVADLGCEEDDEQSCLEGCTEAQMLCPQETATLYECFLAQPLSDYFCDEFDEVSLQGEPCDEEEDAFFACVL